MHKDELVHERPICEPRRPGVTLRRAPYYLNVSTHHGCPMQDKKVTSTTRVDFVKCGNAGRHQDHRVLA
jgi:hypothetical protein